MPTVDLPQGRVEVRVTGPDDATAPAVVFVHGLLVDSLIWSGVIARLAQRGIRAIAPDLPLGAHRTPLAPDADRSPRGVARMIVDLLAALDLSDVTLVGNDTGGALCQFVVDEAVAGRTDRVGRLLLTNCDAFDKFPPPPFGLLVAAGRSERRLRALLAPMRSTRLRHSILGFGGLSSHLDPDVTRGWLEPARTDPAVRSDAARFMREIRPADLMDVSRRLNRFDHPVRIVWGTADRFFRPEMGRRLAAAFGGGGSSGGADFVAVPGARTFVSLDAPDRLADEIASLA